MQTGVCWGLEGHPKAGGAGRAPSLHCHFHMLELLQYTTPPYISLMWKDM